MKYFAILFINFCIFFASSSSPQQVPPNAHALISRVLFKDSDIRDVLNVIASQYQTNISIDNKVNKNISVILHSTSVINAVRLIAEDNGFSFSYDSLRFYIAIKEKLPPPQPPVINNISVKDGMVSFECKNVEISQFIEKLVAISKLNILLSPGSSGKVFGLLSNLPLMKGLSNFLAYNGFLLSKRDSILFVSSGPLPDDIVSPQLKNYFVFLREDRVSIDVINAPLDRIINDVFKQSSFQFVKLAKPTGEVTLKFSDIPLELALYFIFRGSEFTYKFENGIWLVGAKSSKILDDVRLLRIKHNKVAKIKEQIPASLLTAVTHSVYPDQNALILHGNNDNINKIVEFVTAIDKPVPQVLIEAIVVDFNLDNIFQFGLTASSSDTSAYSRSDKWFPGFDISASGKRINKLLSDIGVVSILGNDVNFANLGRLPENFYFNLRALEQDGIANIKSKPLLATLNGYKASLKIGTIQNYVFKEILPFNNALNTSFIERETIQKIEANISFEITPWVGAENEMILEIEPVFNTPVGPFSPDKLLIPAINTRSLFSTVRLVNGETIVLGGLIQETESNTENKFPFLGDIPWLGSFFKTIDRKKSKGELVIYLTPRIYYGNPANTSVFPDYLPSEDEE